MQLSQQQQQEQLRQQYLAAMGVSRWLPRSALPGAAPSPEWQWIAETCTPFPEDLTSKQSGVSPTGNADVVVSDKVRTPKAPLRELLSAQPSVDTEPAQAEPDPVANPAQPSAPISTPAPERSSQSRLSTKPATDPSREPAPAAAEFQTSTVVSQHPGLQQPLNPSSYPRFRLVLVGFDDCLVVTELPTNAMQAWTEQHQQLLQAILSSIGLGKEGVQSQREVNWPLDPMASFDQSAPIAMRALALELKASRKSTQKVSLLMGQAAIKYCVAEPDEFEPGKLIEQSEQLWLPCHGLNEVLRVPGLKAELWQQLQPLRRLSGTN